MPTTPPRPVRAWPRTLDRSQGARGTIVSRDTDVVADHLHTAELLLGKAHVALRANDMERVESALHALGDVVRVLDRFTVRTL